MIDRYAADTDEGQVLRVIQADLSTYLARDKEAWSKHWAQDERMTSFMECGSLQIARGFAEFRDNVYLAMDASPGPTSPDIKRENVNIHVDGDVAWAIFDQIVSDTNDPVAPPNFSHNFRLLERANEAWRIVFHGVWSHPVRDMEHPTIEVDNDGRVQWMNVSAVQRLKSFAGLMVSAGKLRALRPAWDKTLKETITRAGELKNYAIFNKVASGSGQPISYPVFLGEDEAGSVLLCFVVIADGRIYVSFGNHSTLERQIETAGMIYGLSNTQKQLAGHIADGLDLTEAADAMEISINTARTHLRRMFDKTDVRSQIDLLRLFLSFG